MSTRSIVRRRSLPTLLIVAGVVMVASCKAGITQEASDVRDYAAQVNGAIYSTHAGPVTYWFEHGTTPGLGDRTAPRGGWVSSDAGQTAVTDRLRGLAEHTTYYVRTCAASTADAAHPVCGATTSFTTTGGHDYVSGTGVTFSIPELGYAVGSSVDVQAAPDGSAIVGRVETVPGQHYFRLPDTGPITCVRIEGNRAVVGFLSDLRDIGGPDLPLIPILAFYEDNGPTGDRFTSQPLAEPADECPDPSTQGPGSELINGDFTIHDHG